MTPPRAWLLPAPPETPGTGIWKAENNGSAEMAGAVAYAQVSELERLREAEEQLRYIASINQTRAEAAEAREAKLGDAVLAIKRIADRGRKGSRDAKTHEYYFRATLAALKGEPHD